MSVNKWCGSHHPHDSHEWSTPAFDGAWMPGSNYWYCHGVEDSPGLRLALSKIQRGQAEVEIGETWARSHATASHAERERAFYGEEADDPGDD